MLIQESLEYEQLTRSLILSKALRPDMMLPTAHQLAMSILGGAFFGSGDTDLTEMILRETAPRTPIIFSSPPGHDASYKVEQLVASERVTCTSVALGSQEAFTLAEQAIAANVRSGNWVLLKNCHVSLAAFLDRLTLTIELLACSILAICAREEAERTKPAQDFPSVLNNGGDSEDSDISATASQHRHERANSWTSRQFTGPSCDNTLSHD